jgi:hypothetical protein
MVTTCVICNNQTKTEVLEQFKKGHLHCWLFLGSAYVFGELDAQQQEYMPGVVTVIVLLRRDPTLTGLAPLFLASCSKIPRIEESMLQLV